MAIIVIKDPTHPDYPHGEYRGYARGCRCADCLEAKRAYHRDYDSNRSNRNKRVKVHKPKPPPRVESKSTVARLRSLVSIGYTPERLARLLALDEPLVWWILLQPPATVSRAFEKRVKVRFRANWHRDLHDKPEAIRRARALAASMGWPNPLDVLDLDPRPTPTTGEAE
jgi:hypothetical protein